MSKKPPDRSADLPPLPRASPTPDFPGQPDGPTHPGLRPDLLRYEAKAAQHADEVASEKAAEVKEELLPLIAKYAKVVVAVGSLVVVAFTAGIGTLAWAQHQADAGAANAVQAVNERVTGVEARMARVERNQADDAEYMKKKLSRIEELAEYRVPAAARPPPVPEPPPRDGGR